MIHDNSSRGRHDTSEFQLITVDKQKGHPYV